MRDARCVIRGRTKSVTNSFIMDVDHDKHISANDETAVRTMGTDSRRRPSKISFETDITIWRHRSGPDHLGDIWLDNFSKTCADADRLFTSNRLRTRGMFLGVPGIQV
jgi:hypothetical protein